MLKAIRVSLAAAILAFSVAPGFALDQVKGQAAPAASPAAQSATASGSAVVDHGLTTATVTVPPSAEAQTYEIPTKQIIDALLPYIVSAVGGIIAVLGSIVTVWLKQRWNIDVDQSNRNAWQQAAQNAAGALLAKGAVQIEESGKVTVRNAEMANVINMVVARVPGAIKHFGFTPEDIQSLIMAKIPQVMAGSVPAAVAPAPVVQK